MTVLVLAVIVLIAFYLVLPLVLERLVAGTLQDRLELSSEPGVDLHGDPVGMLVGQFDGAEILLPVEEFSGAARPQEISLDLAPFDVNVIASATQRQLLTDGPLSGSIRLALPEEEVSGLAWQGATGAYPILGVDVEEEAATVHSEAAFLGQTLPVFVQGDVGVINGAIIFQPGRVEAAGMQVPSGLTAQMLQGANFSYPVGQLFPGATLTSAELEKDRLILVGEVADLAPR